MANLSVTPANVLPYAGYGEEEHPAGETITAGATLIKLAADDKYYLADCNKTPADAAYADVYAVALNGASAGQPVMGQRSGDINPGGTVSVGQVYCQSATAGAICPEGDLVSTDYVTVIGVGVTASKIHLTLYASGIQHA